MKKTLLFVFFIVLSFISLNTFGQYTNPVYGISIAFDDDGLSYTFDQNDPTVLDPLAQLTEAYYQSGDIVNGDWYVFSAYQGANELWVIDTATGVQTKIADVAEALTGITYSVTDQKMYACNETNFYILDLISGGLTLVGPMGNAAYMKGLASNNAGEIYGIDWSNSSIYQIDPLSGASTLIAPLDLTISYPLDGTINRNTGEYIFSSMTSTSMGQVDLYIVNLETGETSDLGPFANQSQMTALALPYEQSEHGEFNGIVQNIEGAPINGAYVVAAGANYTLTTLTNENGEYDFPVVYPDTYDFTVSAEHFYDATASDISISIGQIISTDFVLDSSYLSVDFTVMDDQSQPIVNAMITLVSDTLYTDASGIAIFEHVSPGTYMYKISAEGYYYKTDEIELIDESLSISAQLITDVNIPRSLVVLEEGTGTWCQYCPAAANGCEDLTQADYPVAIIAYHNGDDYQTVEGDYRLSDYYNTTGFPTVYFDGTTSFIGGANTGTMFNEYAPLVDSLILITSPVDLSFANATYTPESKSLAFDVDIDIIGHAYGNDNRLQIILTESGIAESWQGLDSLQFVERAMINGAAGTTVDLSEMGSTATINASFTLADDWNVNRCQLIAFIQDNDSKEILNAAKLDVASLLEVGVPEANMPQFIIYPNPASNNVFIENARIKGNITITDLAGKIVRKEIIHREGLININVSDLEKGVYIINFRDALSNKEQHFKMLKN